MTEDQDEITLQTLLTYQKLHQKIESFLRERCEELNNASKYFDRWMIDAPSSDFMGFEIFPKFIEVYFQDNLSDYEPRQSSYELPLDVLFNEDFYEIMVKKYKQMKQEKDYLKENEIRNKELKLLEELKKKYEGEE